MTFRSFNYYGFDRETYRDCLDQIHTTNSKHLEIINIWFLINNGMYLFFCMFGWFGVDRRSAGLYAVFTAIPLIFEILVILWKKLRHKQPGSLSTYGSMLMLVAFGVETSRRQPFMAASIFLVLLALCAFSYIDVFGRMAAFLIASTAAFVITSYTAKPLSIFYQDLYNVLTVLVLALILHYTFQRARMSQFETFQQNLQISHELEIRSSFDALTSLLNRGRFFSIAGKMLADSHDDYIAVCLLDLDSFKQINDTMGHQMGDKVIQLAGTTLLDTIGIDLSEKWSFTERVLTENGSIAGRLGGDEFIVMIRGQRDKASVEKLLQNVLSSLNAVDFGELHGIHASFGVTEVTAEDRDMDTVYNRADNALYQSKRAGKNKITFFAGAEGSEANG